MHPKFERKNGIDSNSPKIYKEKQWPIVANWWREFHFMAKAVSNRSFVTEKKDFGFSLKMRWRVDV